MDIYQPGQLDLQQLVDRGAYQSWIFGPGLLDERGKAKHIWWIQIALYLSVIVLGVTRKYFKTGE